MVKVTGAYNTRISLAALMCASPGQRPGLIYRTYLGGPIVLVWDNLNTHTSRAIREPIAARLWLTAYQLTAHAPELNPVGRCGRTSKGAAEDPFPAGAWFA